MYPTEELCSQSKKEIEHEQFIGVENQCVIVNTPFSPTVIDSYCENVSDCYKYSSVFGVKEKNRFRCIK